LPLPKRELAGEIVETLEQIRQHKFYPIAQQAIQGNIYFQCCRVDTFKNVWQFQGS
jgi:hypothetical protein